MQLVSRGGPINPFYKHRCNNAEVVCVSTQGTSVIGRSSRTEHTNPNQVIHQQSIKQSEHRVAAAQNPASKQVDRKLDTMAQDQEDILTTITHFQNQPLSTIRLAEPFSSGPQPPTRSSDVSSSSLNAAAENPTPASLEADLTHYKV